MKEKRVPHKKPAISFFCPAYNDEKNLPILIPKTVKLLHEIASRFEIVIIDDASPDRTGEIADALAEAYKPYVKVIHHTKNRDYGGALQSGIKHAKKYPYVCYTDGDNQYDINVLKTMLSYLPSYDAVVGYRTNRMLTWQRKLQSSIYNFLVRLLFGLLSRDASCSLRIIKRSALKKTKFYSTSAFFAAEMLIVLQRNGARMKEIPVKHYARRHGKASGGNPKVILHTIADMLRFYLRTEK